MLADIGRGLRESRLRRGLTQRAVAMRAGVSRSTVQRVERGRSEHVSLDSLQRAGLAVGRPLRIELAPDPQREPADVGHLGVQELVARKGSSIGHVALPEMPAGRGGSWRSTDLALRNDLLRWLLIVECWNTIGDLGAAWRGTSRKHADGEEYAAGRWGEDPHLVSACWVVRATSRNRALVARYPALFAARFAGSSRAWVRALTTGTEPPREAGLVWCDPAATRLYAWRRPTPRSR
jgi:transcriptional regulator with XRE-family HTH domain